MKWTRNTDYRGYRVWLTPTGWATAPGYADVRFPTLEAALAAIRGWTQP